MRYTKHVVMGALALVAVAPMAQAQSARSERERSDRERAERARSEGRVARVYNLGCGPAQEVQNFLSTDPISDETDLLLLDFNDETLINTTRVLEDLRTRHRRRTGLKLEKKSVHQILKEAGRPVAGAREGYDLVYCAGLFDYLSDRICRRLLEIFYSMVAPGGLLVATNVFRCEPFK